MSNIVTSNSLSETTSILLSSTVAQLPSGPYRDKHQFVKRNSHYQQVVSFLLCHHPRHLQVLTEFSLSCTVKAGIVTDFVLIPIYLNLYYLCQGKNHNYHHFQIRQYLLFPQSTELKYLSRPLLNVKRISVF